MWNTHNSRCTRYQDDWYRSITKHALPWTSIKSVPWKTKSVPFTTPISTPKSPDQPPVSQHKTQVHLKNVNKMSPKIRCRWEETKHFTLLVGVRLVTSRKYQELDGSPCQRMYATAQSLGEKLRALGINNRSSSLIIWINQNLRNYLPSHCSHEGTFSL